MNATISSKGQLVIPESIREQARLRQGDKVDIGYSVSGSRKILWSLRRGQPTKTPFADLWKAVQADTFELHIRLNLGKAAAVMYAADLTEEYVDFNKGTIADPSQAGALGG